MASTDVGTETSRAVDPGGGGGEPVDRTIQDLIQLNLTGLKNNAAVDDDSDDELIDLGEECLNSAKSDNAKTSQANNDTPLQDTMSQAMQEDTTTPRSPSLGENISPSGSAAFHTEPEISEGEVSIDSTAEVQVRESQGGAAADGGASGYSPQPAPEGADREEPLTVELLKEKEAQQGDPTTYTVAEEEEPPPSYEEAMGILTNHGAASHAAANRVPSNPANQMQPARRTAAKSQEPVVIASPGGGNLYYLDFIPHLDFRRPVETFNQLVDRANSWLQTNPTYSVVNCETVVQFWARSHGYNPYRVIATRSKVSADTTVCMHVLRIWFKVDSLQTAPQFIYYQDFWTPYEKRIPDLIDMINSPTFSIPGLILRIETVVHNRGSTAGQSFFQRMRHTCWFETSADNKVYTFFLRVFTLKTASPSQRRGKIGFMDFVPERKRDIHETHPHYKFPHAHYEPFPALVRNFQWWLNNKLSKTARLVTVQSFPVKIKAGHADFWQRVSFTEKSGLFLAPSEYLVIMRAFYEEFGSKAAPSTQSRKVACRSFSPMQLTEGPELRFESFIKMAERIGLWVKLTGAKVRSVETFKIPMYPTAVQNIFSGDDPLTYTSWQILARHYADHSHWIYAIRLYLDEPVEEPPAHTMPAAPNVIPYYLRPPPTTIAIQPGSKY